MNIIRSFSLSLLVLILSALVGCSTTTISENTTKRITLTELTGTYRVSEFSKDDCQTWNAFLPVRKLAKNSTVKIETSSENELLIRYQLKDGSTNKRAFDLRQGNYYWSEGRLVSEEHPSTTGAAIPLGVAFHIFRSFLEPNEHGLTVGSRFTETGLFLLFIPFQDERSCTINLKTV